MTVIFPDSIACATLSYAAESMCRHPSEKLILATPDSFRILSTLSFAEDIRVFAPNLDMREMGAEWLVFFGGRKKDRELSHVETFSQRPVCSLGGRPKASR